MIYTLYDPANDKFVSFETTSLDTGSIIVERCDIEWIDDSVLYDELLLLQVMQCLTVGQLRAINDVCVFSSEKELKEYIAEDVKFDFTNSITLLDWYCEESKARGFNVDEEIEHIRNFQ